MTDDYYIEMALKYGGFMEMDRNFLKNFLSALTETEIKRYLLPSPQVINASFSELYQKRTPAEASRYFFELTRHLGDFYTKPKFDVEGAKSYELFRFIRLNIDGEAHGFCYTSDLEEGMIFSQLPKVIDEKFLLHIAQIFPNYVIWEDTKTKHVRTKPMTFEGFGSSRDVTTLTESSENEDFIKFVGYNIDDLLENAENTRKLGNRYYQYQKQRFTIYQTKH